MKRQNWEHVAHAPEWVAAPLKVNLQGDTKPGFLCIHELENGNGLCASTSFEEADGDHICVVILRGRWNISRPCYDKPRRCPGWAGGGWKGAEYQLCRGDSGYVDIDFEDKRWRWKAHKCTGCGVVVLPFVIKTVSPRTWWYEIRFARDSWTWLFRLETWWGRKRGKW